MNFTLTLRTPNETLFTGEAKSISFHAENGAMQIMAHHASMTTTLIFSSIRIETEGMEDIFLVRNGIFLFNNAKNEGLLLALHGEKRSEISHQTAKEYLNFVLEQLKKGEDLSETQILYLEGEKLAVEEQIKTLAN